MILSATVFVWNELLLTLSQIKKNNNEKSNDELN